MEHVFRQPDRSASGTARRHHAGATACAGRVRRAVSRGARSGAADVRAHARHAARRDVRLGRRVAARIPTGTERRALVGLSYPRDLARTRGGTASAVLSHRIRRNGDAGLGTNACLRRATRAHPSLRRSRSSDEPRDRAVGGADHAVGRRRREGSRHHEAASAGGRHRQLSLRHRIVVRAVYREGRRRRIRSNGRPGREQLGRNLSGDRYRARQRARIHRRRKTGTRARTVSNRVARRR